jgi:single-stranded-DNA-specific exonuclease
MDKKNLAAFQQRFEEVVAARLTSEMLTPSIEIDTVVSFDAITTKFINVLKQMAPFGPGNQKPLFETQNVFVSNGLSQFKERHLRFMAKQHHNEAAFQVVGFDLGEYYQQLATAQTFKMVYTIEENFYNGITTTQLRAKDFKFE